MDHSFSAFPQHYASLLTCTHRFPNFGGCIAIGSVLHLLQREIRWIESRIAMHRLCCSVCAQLCCAVLPSPSHPSLFPHWPLLHPRDHCYLSCSAIRSRRSSHSLRRWLSTDVAED